MAYGLHLEKSDESKRILVFDFGGGTLDVTLVEIAGGVFEVKATGGDTHLGGEDIDSQVVNHFVDEFKKKYKKDPSKSHRALRRLRTAAERAKRTLSASTQATVEVDSLYEGLDFYTTLSRAKFEALNGDIFRRTIFPIDGVLRDAKLRIEDVDEVVLVGGSSRIPKIQEMLKSKFNGKEPCHSVNPDEAVAHGAAVQAAILQGKASGAASECLLLDVTPLSLGVEAAGGKMAVIIERNTSIPVTKSKMFSTNRDNQSSVAIKVYEGERAETAHNNLLGTFTLEGIPPAPRATPQIEVKFDVNANGILSITAEEKQSGRKGEISISPDKGRLSKEDIDRMLKQAQEYAELDQKREEEMEWSNHLENYAYNIKSKMTEDRVSNELTSEEREKLTKAADDAIQWLQDNDHPPLHELKEKQKELESVYNPIITRVYNKLEEGTA